MYSLTSEPFKLDRDVEAIAVPTGETIELPAGVVGYITQALGGSFTIFVDGSMFMILGHNADALGKEPLPAPTLPENATQQDVEEAVWAQLKTVYDPEIPVSIVELGLVYECVVKSGDKGYEVAIDMTLTAPGCGMGDVLVSDAAAKIKLIPEIQSVHCQIVFDPPWDQSMMSEEAKLETGML
ncbi:putative Fe-S cluster assembly protein SufT [Marinicella litoralis]|uniref:Putative FeS assembly SUF system protein SufT n=1 Tax=Marinicella litoralis TaxID=644220 RepID=A0A4R6XUE4_9GAMM|nr:putative Fe-S cluster assembly protein SufT [Marinicella litoralis]TDR23625.1 putative FeS assembly SUF system protein SufT [Marinicella litoralis]